MNGARPDWRALIVPIVLAALGSIAPTLAWAETMEKEWFLLLIDSCVPVQAQAVEQQVAIELGPLRSWTRPVVGPVKLVVSCHGAQTWLQTYSTASGQGLFRSMDLNLQSSEIRERILALSF